MPLNIRKFGVSWFLVLFSVFAVFAQSPTSGDVMRDRIKKAKAFVAIKNYSAAIYELEGIRRETSDATVGSVIQVMLMNCYLEQSDYKRAQSLLTEIFNAQKTNRPNANYFVVAAQVVKGARMQLERYKSLGLMVSDQNLPPDAVADVNKMRETVEMVITQSRTLGENKKQTSDAMAILEEATNARSGLARDDFDAKRWKDETADARESLMNSRSVVNAVDDSGMPAPNTAAVNTAPANTSAGLKTNGTIPAAPVSAPNNSAAQTNINSNQTAAQQPVTIAAPTPTPAPNATGQASNNTNAAPPAASPTPNVSNAAAETAKSPSRVRRVENNDSPPAAGNAPNNNQSENKTVATNAAGSTENKTPIAVGSLIDYATQKVNPVYPPAAKNVRMTGIVRVDVVVSEDGKIAEVQNTSGPSMLQRAALDAVKHWKFRPFMRDGQPVKAIGYLSFNFNM